MQVPRVYVSSPPGINQQPLVQNTVFVVPGVANSVPKPDWNHPVKSSRGGVTRDLEASGGSRGGSTCLKSRPFRARGRHLKIRQYEGFGRGGGAQNEETGAQDGLQDAPTMAKMTPREPNIAPIRSPRRSKGASK
eukprot:1336820-Pyramimonas_sp.AAC.1